MWRRAGPWAGRASSPSPTADEAGHESDDEREDDDDEEEEAATGQDLAAVRALLAVVESEIAAGEIPPRQIQRLAEPLVRAGLLDPADPAAVAAGLRRALVELSERLAAPSLVDHGRGEALTQVD